MHWCPQWPPWLVPQRESPGSQDVKGACKSRATDIYVPRTQEVMCSTSMVHQAAGFEVECRNSLERKWVNWGELRLVLPAGQNSLTGREITYGDFHSAMRRWGLMNVVMIMMIIIQILSYLDTPGRSVLRFVIWLNLRGDPPTQVYSVMSYHIWWSVSLPLHHSNQQYAQQCARYLGGCKRKMSLSGDTCATLTLMPGPGVGVCTGNTLKHEISGVRAR